VSRSSAPQVLERTDRETARPAAPRRVVASTAAAPDAGPEAAAPEVTGPADAEIVDAEVGAPTRRTAPRLLAGRRLPHPPGRRAPMWFAALVVGALLAAAPTVIGSPEQSMGSASEYGLGTGDISLTGGIDDAGVRRSITEAEAQARLGELAASRAARAPKAVVPVTDYRLTTCFCQRWGQMHPGWDLAAPLGTPIYSAADGVVLQAGRKSGYGNAVYIQDAEGNVHIYGHMRYYDVEAGDVVRAGDQIAKVGNEGFSTGPHLHWQIHRGGIDGRPIDPEEWLAERDISV
jgi:murein DD-endopeptidase MepM/ murein hydrolase activator NlpD